MKRLSFGLTNLINDLLKPISDFIHDSFGYPLLIYNIIIALSIKAVLKKTNINNITSNVISAIIGGNLSFVVYLVYRGNSQLFNSFFLFHLGMTIALFIFLNVVDYTFRKESKLRPYALALTYILLALLIFVVFNKTIDAFTYNKID